MKKRAYTGAYIINGNKAVSDVENGTILVNEEGRIEDIFSGNTIPDGYEKIDCSGKFIMPGLINAHVHLFSRGAAAAKSGAQGSWVSLAYAVLRSPLGKLIMTPVYKKSADMFLQAGVTTIRDVGSFYQLDVKMRDRINSGKMDGPRIVASGSLIIATGGHGYAMPSCKQISGVSDAIRAARENIRDGSDWIKICTTGGVTDSKFFKGTDCTHLTLDETKAIVEEAHRRNMMVASHCESTVGMRDCLAAGVDTIEHGSVIEPDMVPMFKNNPKALRGYTAVIPTILAGGALHEHSYEDTPANRVVMANSRYVAEGSDEALKTAYAEGIALGVGTDSSVPFCTPYNTYRELIKFCEVTGMSTREAIDYGTRETADIIGLGDETGTLDSGKSADFIVLKANPLEDLNNLRHPERVIARGLYYPNPSYKEFPGIE